MAKPLGAVFWVLSLLMLALGLANYIRKWYFFFFFFLQNRRLWMSPSCRPARRGGVSQECGVSMLLVETETPIWRD